MRNETNDIVRGARARCRVRRRPRPSGSVHRVPFLLPLDTFFRTDLTPAMINEGIRGMLLKLF